VVLIGARTAPAAAGRESTIQKPPDKSQRASQRSSPRHVRRPRHAPGRRYDSMERFCGVRFYGPKADSVVFPGRRRSKSGGRYRRGRPVIQHASGSRLRLAHHAGSIRQTFRTRVGALSHGGCAGAAFRGTPTTRCMISERFPKIQIPNSTPTATALLLIVGPGPARRPGLLATILTGKPVPGWTCRETAFITPSCPRMRRGSASAPNARACWTPVKPT